MALDLAKHRSGKSYILPLSVHLYYHARILDLLSKNQLTAEAMQKLDVEMDAVHKAVEKPEQKPSSVS